MNRSASKSKQMDQKHIKYIDVIEKPMAKQFSGVKVRVGQDFIDKQRNIQDRFSVAKDPYSYMKEGRIILQDFMKYQEQPSVSQLGRNSNIAKQHSQRITQLKSSSRPKTSQSKTQRFSKVQEYVTNSSYKDQQSLRQISQSKFKNNISKSSSRFEGRKKQPPKKVFKDDLIAQNAQKLQLNQQIQATMQSPVKISQRNKNQSQMSSNQQRFYRNFLTEYSAQTSHKNVSPQKTTKSFSSLRKSKELLGSNDRNSRLSSKRLNTKDTLRKSTVRNRQGDPQNIFTKKMMVAFGLNEQMDKEKESLKELQQLLVQKTSSRNESPTIVNISNFKSSVSEQKIIPAKKIQFLDQKQNFVQFYKTNEERAAPSETPEKQIPVKQSLRLKQKNYNQFTMAQSKSNFDSTNRKQPSIPKLQLDVDDSRLDSSSKNSQQMNINNMYQLIIQLKQQRAQKKDKKKRQQPQQSQTQAQNMEQVQNRKKHLFAGNHSQEQQQMENDINQIQKVNFMQKHYSYIDQERPLQQSRLDQNPISEQQLQKSTILESSNFYIASSHRSHSYERALQESQSSVPIDQLPWSQQRKDSPQKSVKRLINERNIESENQFPEPEKEQKIIVNFTESFDSGIHNYQSKKHNKQIQIKTEFKKSNEFNNSNSILSSIHNLQKHPDYIETQKVMREKISIDQILQTQSNDQSFEEVSYSDQNFEKKVPYVPKKVSQTKSAKPRIKLPTEQIKQQTQNIQSNKLNESKEIDSDDYQNEIEQKQIEYQQRKEQNKKVIEQILLNDDSLDEDNLSSIQNPYQFEVENVDFEDEDHNGTDTDQNAIEHPQIEQIDLNQSGTDGEQNITEPSYIEQTENSHLFSQNENKLQQSLQLQPIKKTATSATNLNNLSFNYQSKIQNTNINQIDSDSILQSEQQDLQFKNIQIQQQYITDDENRVKKSNVPSIQQLKRMNTQKDVLKPQRNNSTVQRAYTSYQASNIFKQVQSPEDYDAKKQQNRDAKSVNAIARTFSLVLANRCMTDNDDDQSKLSKTAQIRELNLFETFKNQNNESHPQIPRLNKDYYFKRYRIKCVRKHWSEWICIIKKSHCDKDLVKIQDEDEKLSAHSKCINSCYQFQDTKYAIVKQYPHQMIQVDEDNFKSNQQSIYLKNSLYFEEQLKENQLKNKSIKPITFIEKQMVEDDSSTWVYQDFINKPQFNSIKKQIAIDHGHEQDEKLYFTNLQESLFKIEDENTKKDEVVKNIQHCCFYSILHKDQDDPNRKSFLKQLIKEIAIQLLNFQAAGVVHGQLNSLNIEYKVKKAENKGDSDILVDLMFTNSEYSYDFHKRDPDTYKRYLGLDFENPECLPPEIIKDLFNYESHGGKQKQFKTCSSIKPWSHDVWSFGILLVEIITGFPMQVGDKCVLRPKLCGKKLFIGRGIFAVSNQIYQTDGGNNKNSLLVVDECSKKCDKRLTYQKLIQIHENFTNNIRRQLKVKDIYKLLRDKYLLDLICQMLCLDTCQRISPQKILEHPYFKP